MPYQYQIRINQPEASPEAEENHFEYSFGPTKGIQLRIDEKAARIEFSMTGKKNVEDLMAPETHITYDALRKVQLLHAVIYGTGLDIDEITVSTADESRSFGKNDPCFPFLFSILPKKDFDPGRTWNQSAIKEEICKTTKSDISEDRRFSALYAFLGAMSKEYEIDRFSGLWISMNAFYKFVYKTKSGKTPDNKDAKNNRTSDKCCIGLLLEILNCREKPTKKCQEENQEGYKGIKKCLCGLSEKEIEALCEMLEEQSQEKQIAFSDERFSPINDLSQKASIKPYGLMLLKYPYYLRCRYFHGEQPTLLFSSYGGTEISALRVVNHILKRFLLDKIPLMFQDDFLERIKPAVYKGENELENHKTESQVLSYA